jgi:outer membrane protein TolC
MKQFIIIIICVIAFNFNLLSQNNIEYILNEIEKNNATLSAFRKNADAGKIGNKTGIYLQNPEIEFNYLWGNPSSIGNRTDFSITQTFDFPTAYGIKNHLSDIKNEQFELEYIKQQKIVLFETRNVCIELMYANAQKLELMKRLGHAQQIANSYKVRFDAGDANILEFNKAQLNLLNLNNQIKLVHVEQNALLSELTRLNGGVAIDFAESEFQVLSISPDFETWYAQAEQSYPVLNWLKQEIEISKKQISLNKALSLPKLHTGYMSETVVGQQFRGVSIGVSVPLWENKNNVKYAKANAIALEAVVADTKIQLYNQLKSLHSKANVLQQNVIEYRTKLLKYNSSELLRKALEEGEISIVEYSLELAFYYDSTDKLLEMERELHKTWAELNQYL